MGTRLTIWKQGQFYPELGKKQIELPNRVERGPSDNLVSIYESNVEPDTNGNFLSDDYSCEEFDAVHTFGIVRLTIDLFEKYSGLTVKWSWNRKGDTSPLSIKISNNDINARFLAESKCIELDYYGKNDELIYNCRTTDLVIHETGHAIINSIFPEWQNSNAETRGLEEAFCDLSAMFFILSQYDLCKEVIRKTNGDLTQSSMLTLFGVGHGPQDNFYREIRNALNTENYQKDFWDQYSYCRVLTAVMYEFLIELLNEKQTDCVSVLNLFKTGKIWQKMIVQTLIRCNPFQTSLAEFACNFIRNYPEQENILIALFQKRGVYW